MHTTAQHLLQIMQSLLSNALCLIMRTPISSNRAQRMY